MRILALLLCTLISHQLFAQDFGPRNTLRTGYDGAVYDHQLADMDNDGDLDILRLHEYYVTWSEQAGINSGMFLDPVGIFAVESRSSAAASNRIVLADLTLNGFTDVIVDDIYALNAGGVFSTPRNTGLGIITHVADIDDDGIPDILRASASCSNCFRWKRNRGNGNFETTSPTLIGTPPARLMATGNFAGDDRDDLVLSHSGNVYLYYRTAGSGWLSKVIHTGALGRTATSADLNGDGKLDLVLAQANNSISVLLNVPGDSLAFSETLASNFVNPIQFSRIAIGDYDSDGALDIAWGDNGGSIRLALNDGVAGFAERRTLLTGPSVLATERLALGDLNNDGRTDVLRSGDVNEILWQTQGDSLTAGPSVGGGLELPRKLASADLNDDGQAELLEFNSVWSYRTLNGSQLGSLTPIPGQEGSSFVDLNNDGLPEIASFVASELIVYTNLGNFQWDGGTSVPGFLPAGKSVGYGDMDGDGDIDLFAANGTFAPDDTAYLWLYLNDGLGNFTAQVVDTDVQVVLSARAADVDRDGDLDMVLTKGGAFQELLWYRNEGSGVFIEQQVNQGSPPANVHTWESHDVDGDGDFDLVFAQNRTSYQDVGYLEQLDDGSFSDPVRIRRVSTQGSYAFVYFSMADFDGDGDLDCAVGSGYHTAIYFTKNDGNGNFTDVGTIYNQNNIGNLNSISNVDLDGDGAPELLAFHSLDSRPHLSYFSNLQGANHTIVRKDIAFSCDDNGTPSQQDDKLIIDVLADGPTDTLELEVWPVNSVFTFKEKFLPNEPAQFVLQPGSAGGGELRYFINAVGTSMGKTWETETYTCSSGPDEVVFERAFTLCDDDGTDDRNIDDDLEVVWTINRYGTTPSPGYDVLTKVDDFTRLHGAGYSEFNSTVYENKALDFPDSTLFTIVDRADSSKRWPIWLEMPGACSYVTLVDSVSVACDDNGTPADSLDDRTAVTMRVSGPDNFAMRVLMMRDSISLAGGFELHNEVVTVSAWPGSVFEDSVRVAIEQEGRIAQTFVVASPGVGCSAGASSLEGFRQNQLQVYPNPLRGNVLGITGEQEVYEVKLYDALGRMVQTKLIANQSVDLGTLSSGTYYLRAFAKTGEPLGGGFVEVVR